MIKLGHDIVNIDRIKNLIEKYGNKFLYRIFTKNEILASGKCKDRDKSIAFLAKRFAAKEAFAKAIGTGIRNGIEFVQIEVLNNELGAPILNLHGKAREIADSLGITDIAISLSDEYPYCSAVVLIYAEPGKISEKNVN